MARTKKKMSKLIGQSIAAIYATPPEKRAEAWPELRNVIVTANPSMAEKIPETFDQKWVDVNSMSIIGPDAWRQLQQKKNIKMHTWQEGGDKVFGGVDEDEGKVAFEIARGPAKEVKTEDVGKKRQYWLNEITKHSKSLETIGKATKLDQLTAILGKDFGIGMPETLTEEDKEKARAPIRRALENAENELKKLEGSSAPASSRKAAVVKYKTKEEVRRDFKLGKFGPPESEEAQLKAQAVLRALEL